MSKIVFFNIPSTGHLLPMQAVITELVRRGHHVLYYNTEEYRPMVEQTGAEFRAYQPADSLAALSGQASAGNIADNAVALAKIAHLLLPQIFDVLRTEKPDLVIHDSLAGWGKQAAEALNMRAAASLVTFVLQPDMMLKQPAGLILRSLRDFGLRIPAYQRVAAETRRVHNVKTYGLNRVLMNLNEMTIIFTSREFQPSGTRLDDHYKFVGPSIAERPDTSGFPFDQLTGQPLIYISLGTINNQNDDFYRACFAAFADDPRQIVLSVGKKTEIARLGAIPSNFIVRNFVPQLDILQRTDLFITHGGMGSVHEGLWYGVPLIVVPQQLEQAMVAEAVQKHGAGLVGATLGKQMTADDLRTFVQRVLADKTRFQAAARHLGDTFRSAGGYMRAADELEAYAHG